MKRRKVESSMITSWGYLSGKKVLEVRFKGGGVYQYGNVTLSEWDELKNASSKGSIFHILIRGKKPEIHLFG